MGSGNLVWQVPDPNNLSVVHLSWVGLLITMVLDFDYNEHMATWVLDTCDKSPTEPHHVQIVLEWFALQLKAI